MVASDEKEEMFDDWEDDGFPSEDVDADGFPVESADSGSDEAGAKQQAPAKKKRGGGVLLFLLILLGGAGGGFYFLTTPGGAPYRDYLPEAVRGFLPAAEAPKPKMAAKPQEEQQDIADALDGDLKSDGTQQTADTVDPIGFQAPPMPSLSDTEETASADNTNNIENVTGFDVSGDDKPVEETETNDNAVAWGDTPSEDNVMTLSFDSAADNSAVTDTETVADGEEAAPLTFTTNTAAEEKAEADNAPENLPVAVEKQPEDRVAAFSAADERMPAVKTEQLIDLEDRMSVLEKAVSGLEKSVATKKDLSALQGDLSSLQADIRSLRSELKKAASAPRNVAPAPKAAASAGSETSSVKAKTATVAKPAPQREWVMVSAQPGTAWISEKGSSGKREVSVGDTVPGLGRITSVAPDTATGRWVVKGTRGTLHQ